MKYLRLFALVPLLIGASCASRQPSLDVNIYQLTDLSEVGKDNPMVRSEQQKRLYGAVQLEEKKARMGQYYTVRWDLKEQQVHEPLRVEFLYRQSGSGVKVHQLVSEVQGREPKGVCEFAIIGDDYHQGGRVLSWKIQLFSGHELLLSEQSYLWE